MHSGVPQGSVLGPILFTTYIKPLSVIIDSHSIAHHSFADDLQLQMSAPPDIISELLHSMQSCICDVKAWATANMLRLYLTWSTLVVWFECRFLATEVDGSNPGNSMLFP